MIVEWWDAMRPTPFQKFPPLPTVPFIYIFYFGEMRKLGHRKLIYSSLWLIRFAASAISRKCLIHFFNLLSCSRKASPRTHFMAAPLLAFINIHKYEQSGAGKDIWFRFWLPPLGPLKRTLCHSFINISRKAMLESENIPGHMEKNRFDFFESLLWLHSFLSGTNKPLKRFFRLNGKSSSRNTIYPFYWIVERAQKLP